MQTAKLIAVAYFPVKQSCSLLAGTDIEIAVPAIAPGTFRSPHLANSDALFIYGLLFSWHFDNLGSSGAERLCYNPGQSEGPESGVGRTDRVYSYLWAKHVLYILVY